MKMPPKTSKPVKPMKPPRVNAAKKVMPVMPNSMMPTGKASPVQTGNTPKKRRSL